MNINTPEDAKAMIEEVKAKGPEAVERQLEKIYTDEMLLMAIKGLWLCIDCIKSYDRHGNQEDLQRAKQNLNQVIEIMNFAQLALVEDIEKAKTKPNT